MTAPKTCENCGAALDAGETCDCREAAQDSGLIRLVQLPVIEERLRDLKEATERRTDQAMSMVCAPDTLAAVKTVRAELNREFAEIRCKLPTRFCTVLNIEKRRTIWGRLYPRLRWMCRKTNGWKCSKCSCAMGIFPARKYEKISLGIYSFL